MKADEIIAAQRRFAYQRLSAAIAELAALERELDAMQLGSVAEPVRRAELELEAAYDEARARFQDAGELVGPIASRRVDQ